MANVRWNGTMLILETRPSVNGGSCYDLDRICSKLSRRGFTITRTGQSHKRYATPVNPKYGHPKDKMILGKVYQWDC